MYLATLELGADTIQNIAKKAGLKRPNVYLITEELMTKGLLSKKPMPRGDLFIAENPEHLKDILREREKHLGDALPFLRAIYNVEKDKPQVQVYEGIENMKKIYFDLILKSKSEVLFFSSVKKINEAIPDLLDSWLQTTKNEDKSKIQSRELINPDPEDVKYGLKAIKTGQMQVRVIPKGFPILFAGTDNAIFENKLMIVSFEQKLFTTIIQSKVIADTMRALYELAWQQAQTLEDFLQKNPEFRQTT